MGRAACAWKPRRVRGAGRDQGLVLMLLAIGIPLVAFFIQVDGAVKVLDRGQGLRTGP